MATIADKSKSLTDKGQESIDKKQRKKRKGTDTLESKESEDDSGDDDEEDDEEGTADIDNLNSDAYDDGPIVKFFSKSLSTREKISLKKAYISYLKDYISTFRPKNKDIIDIKCSMLKPLYQRPGYISMTSHDLIFFDELYTPPSHN